MPSVRAQARPPAVPPAASVWPGWLLGPCAAGAILLVFWAAMLMSLRSKSLTADEPGHAVAGYSYWRFGDYRLDPENGNLPQRWMALPLLAGNHAFSPANSGAWLLSDMGTLGEEWFNRMGNDTAGMAFRGRAMCGLMAVALGALVWWWSRRLFGPAGGMVSLLLFVLDPTILANGALMTSDTACALAFLASAAGLWAVLRRVTVPRLLLSGLAMGGLFAAKMSGILIVPIALILALVRVFSGPAVDWDIGGLRRLAGWRPRAAAVFAVAAAHAAVVFCVIWGLYGFRYQAFAVDAVPGSRLEHDWTELLGPSGAPGRPAAARAFEFLRGHRVLPEAYLYGQAHVWRFSRQRSAFLDGRFSVTGWRWFFPYAFLVKTPLPVFGVIALAALACRRRPLYGLAPLATLFCVYWAVAIASALNIGHRHILPTYPPLFVFCGASALWLGPSALPAGTGRARWPGLALLGLIAALAGGTAFCFPNYIAYFNAIAGGTANGYRRLVDSSLDWGQDLPDLRRYIENHPGEGPAYLSYFGIASPDAYGIPAKYLYSVRGQDVTPGMQILNAPADQARSRLDALLRAHPEYRVVGGARPEDGTVDVIVLKTPASLRLGPGTYFISASMLQPVMYELSGPVGPWNARYEGIYQLFYSAVKPLMSDDPAVRDAALRAHAPAEWRSALAYFDLFRFARLTAYLRKRAPADTVDGSILVYPLGEADISEAVDGPPPELGADIPVRSGLFKPAPLP